MVRRHPRSRDCTVDTGSIGLAWAVVSTLVSTNHLPASILRWLTRLVGHLTRPLRMNEEREREEADSI